MTYIYLLKVINENIYVYMNQYINYKYTYTVNNNKNISRYIYIYKIILPYPIEVKGKGLGNTHTVTIRISWNSGTLKFLATRNDHMYTISKFHLITDQLMEGGRDGGYQWVLLNYRPVDGRAYK